MFGRNNDKDNRSPLPEIFVCALRVITVKYAELSSVVLETLRRLHAANHGNVTYTSVFTLRMEHLNSSYGTDTNVCTYIHAKEDLFFPSFPSVVIAPSQRVVK